MFSKAGKWMFLVLASILGTSACTRSSSYFKGPEKLASNQIKYPTFAAVEPDAVKGENLSTPRLIPAATLNVGHDTYVNYCMQCHGMDGKGNGPAAQGMYPPPRNFTQGIFKYVSGKSGDLPLDEDLVKTIRYGLRGTHMLPWDMSQQRIEAVVQYIKTFAPQVWRDGSAGIPWVSYANPWKGKEEEAILLGKKVYHGLAQCYACHPGYASASEINAYSKELTGSEAGEIRADTHLSILQDSSYGHKFMPPDFTKNWIKSMRIHADLEIEIEDIYRMLGSGIGGTTMPSWEGVLSSNADETKRVKESSDRMWAVAYYVHKLQYLRFDWEARKKFFEELNDKRAK
jgi:mono/diheme cytochrome c family protein